MLFPVVSFSRNESQQKIAGFDSVFREEASETTVFMRVEEPLLMDSWNGHSTTMFVVGQGRNNVVEAMQVSFEHLFGRIEESAAVTASVLRHKVYLSVFDVFPERVVDSLALGSKAKTLSLGSSGVLSPSVVEVVSAAEAVARLKEISKPRIDDFLRKRPPHRICSIRLDRWTRSRKRGLLTPERGQVPTRIEPIAENEEENENWSVSSSYFEKVFIDIREAPPGTISGLDQGETKNPDSIGVHASSHGHRLEKSVAQTLTSFCRCVRENGLGFRDSRLTHVMRHAFQDSSRCVVIANVLNGTDNYGFCAGPLRFAERVLRALQSPTSARVEITEDEEFNQLTGIPVLRRPTSASSSNKMFRVVESQINSLFEELTIQGLEREPVTDETEHASSFSWIKKTADSSFEAFDEINLKTSRDALKKQLERFQRPGLLNSSFTREISEDEADSHDDRLKKVEAERQDAIKRGQELMQENWDLEASRGDALRKVRLLEERVAFLGSELEAKMSDKPSMEDYRHEHAREMERAQEELFETAEEEREDAAQKFAALEKEKCNEIEAERQKAHERLKEVGKRHAEEIEEFRKRMRERDDFWKRKLEAVKEERRREAEQRTSGGADKERRIRMLEDRIHEMENLHENRLQIIKNDFEVERGHLTDEISQHRECIENLHRDLDLAKDIQRERDQTNEDALRTARARIEALQIEVSSQQREILNSARKPRAGSVPSPGSMSASKHGNELINLRKRNRELSLEYEKLQHQLKNAWGDSENVASLQEQLTRRNEEVQSLKKVAEELSRAHSEACDDLEAANKRIQSLEEEFRNHQNDRKSEILLGQLEEKLTLAQQEIRSLRSEKHVESMNPLIPENLIEAAAKAAAGETVANLTDVLHKSSLESKLEAITNGRGREGLSASLSSNLRQRELEIALLQRQLNSFQYC